MFLEYFSRKQFFLEARVGGKNSKINCAFQCRARARYKRKTVVLPSAILTCFMCMLDEYKIHQIEGHFPSLVIATTTLKVICFCEMRVANGSPNEIT